MNQRTNASVQNCLIFFFFFAFAHKNNVMCLGFHLGAIQCKWYFWTLSNCVTKSKKKWKEPIRKLIMVERIEFCHVLRDDHRYVARITIAALNYEKYTNCDVLYEIGCYFSSTVHCSHMFLDELILCILHCEFASDLRPSRAVSNHMWRQWDFFFLRSTSVHSE